MTNVLILGGGFGGVRTALDLAKKFRGDREVAITLIDRQSSQTFTPSLYEIASVYQADHQHPYHTNLKSAVSISYKDIFAGTKVNFVQAETNHIDLEGRHVSTSGGSTIPFDYLVIALGSVVSTYDIPGVEAYAYKFKTVNDALLLADKLDQSFHLASQSGRKSQVRIVIGGAGFTGIELAAELSTCVRHIAKRHGMIHEDCASVTLLEAGPTILPMIKEGEKNIIRRRLAKLGVNILENAAISEVGPNYVKTKLSGEEPQTLEADIVIWSAGIKALPILKEIKGLMLDDRGRVVVNRFLQIEEVNGVFAVGDAIAFSDPKNNKPIPQMAYLAIEQGRVVAQNIARKIESSKPQVLIEYKPKYDTWIAPAGGKYALAHIGKWSFAGWPGYLIRQLVDLRYFLSVLEFDKAIKLFRRNAVIFSKND